MKKILTLSAILFLISSGAFSAQQLTTSGSGATHQWSVQKDRINANDTELYGHKVASGSVSGGTLTLTLADTSTVVIDVSTLVNTDAQTITNLSLNVTTNVLTVALSGGNTATVDLTGLITKALTVTASGFDGNLATTDDTLQKVAQKLDDLVISGGATAINDLTDVDTTGKATGKVLKFDASGNLVVGDDEIGAAGTGDITGVTAGTGLTGGGDTGAVTIALSTATLDEIAANTAKVTFPGFTSLVADYSFDPATKQDVLSEGAFVDGDKTKYDNAQPSLGTVGTAGNYLVEESVIGVHGLAVPGTWKVFYTDGSGGGLKELSIGSVGTYLKSNGTGGAPEWDNLSALKTKQPVTLNLTTDTSVSEAQLLANDFITNQGAAGEVDITLPAVSYTITRTIIVNEEQVVEVGPPSGEALDLSGTMLDADDVVDSPATVGSKLVVTRMQNAAGAWHYSLDVVRGTWADSGASD